jgi:CheY-like chemotaxis protein
VEELKKSLLEYNNLSILYVDDEISIREQMKKVLGRIFQDVTTAIDGQDALTISGTRRFDVIVTDVQMPNMNGIELTRELLNVNPEQIIIVTTAFNQDSELMEIRNMGIKNIIEKPVSLHKFFTVLLTALESR